MYVERFIQHDIVFIPSTLKRVVWDQAPGSLKRGKGAAQVSPHSPPPPLFFPAYYSTHSPSSERHALLSECLEQAKVR